MRDRGTLNPGNQHLTHLMLMSGIIINISHTHTQTYTETPCSPSHHLTYISTGGKFYPRAQCQHVCINKSTQNAHRLKELILSRYLFFFPPTATTALWIHPLALRLSAHPPQTQPNPFYQQLHRWARLISQRCLVPRRANARSLPSVISPPSLFTLCFCSFFPLIHLWDISAFEVRCDTIKRLPFLPNSFTGHRGWGPCGDPTFRSSPQPVSPLSTAHLIPAVPR